ncbi:efflux RND transporter periplasmic adaptor subunit [Salidesulfovibrio onnuriiensis]|uniref:efflux RND transporter periplasmic adaptor subunit n=1 Tax=Salidesulfovibrio onnuriiensis TaxID=2583823 RepID=UPI0011C9F59E|nr:efflux RND transporter periplasmic adaptor subunit [Salidesulfovibrio onnuriiensis]
MKKYFLIFILIAAVVAGGSYFLLSGNSETIRIIKTAAVERGTVRKVLEATGIIKAQVGAMLKIGARATGTLEKVEVKVGDPVREGDLVAVVDDREIQAKVAEAKAKIKLAEAKYAYAAKNLPRQRKLVRQKLEPQDTLDQAEQETQVARFELEAAKATLETLRIQLTYCKIYSPIDGIVSQVAAQEGETIVSGLNVSNLVTILAPERLEMWIYVDETDIGRVAEGMPVEFTVDSFADKVFKGSVERVYPEPEIRDNIVYYRALVTVTGEQAGFLRPEMTTQCRIIVETRSNVLSIPNSALKWVAGRQVVYVGEPEGNEPREVVPELGLQGLERSEVLAGLKEGEPVATQLVIPGRKLGEKGI